MTEEIQLLGCSTRTMMHYLKALGILRILSNQKYPNIKSKWKNSNFYLQIERESKINLEDELVEFFLNKYKPTPMITPWNGGGGFITKTKTANYNLKRIENSKDLRLETYRTVILETKKILGSIKHNEKSITNNNGEILREIWNTGKKKDIKLKILRACRNNLPDEAIVCFDTMYMLTSKNPSYNIMLGTGGNDGNGEFINTFMKNLCIVFNQSNSKEWIRGSLFNKNVKMNNGLLGQYASGYLFAPNMTNIDKNENSLVNPWDYILMMEGTLLFAGNITRHLSSESTGKGSFPFIIETTIGGDHTTTSEELEKNSNSKEIWIPIWNKKTSFAEIQYLFREGRAQLGGKYAKSGLDFVRAVIGLGTERGITEFYRFVVRKRNGKNNIIIPAGKIIVKKNRFGEALYDIDKWIKNIKIMKNKPQTIKSNLKNLENSIFDFTFDIENNAKSLQQVLIEIGKMEINLSKSKKTGIQSVQLSTKWIEYCYDKSPEFRLAASLASIVSEDIGSIRENIEAVDLDNNKMDKNNNSIVNKKNSHIKYISSIFERRCIDTQKKRLQYLAIKGMIPANIQDIVDFLHGRINMTKLLDLFIPLSFIDYQDVKEKDISWNNERTIVENYKYIPYAFAVLKMIFWHYKYNDKYIKFELSILSLLRAGRIDEAFNIAQNRLLYSGFLPVLKTKNRTKVILPKSIMYNIEAALLFPLSKNGMDKIARVVLH